MTDTQIFSFEGREFQYIFRPAKEADAPLLVLLHGHAKTPRPLKFRDAKWNVLCPVDNFGVESSGSWYLGENGDFFWLRAMPDIIKHVYSGNKIFFAGSSMGGYGAILHGSLNKAYGVYANVAQTRLLGSTYSENGMKKFFKPIFHPDKTEKYNDLRKVIQKGTPTTFIISGYRYDKVNYVEEQTFPFLQDLLKKKVNFANEVWLGKGHNLTHSFAQVAEKFQMNMEAIVQNYEKASQVDTSNTPAVPLFSDIPQSHADVGRILVEHGQWYNKRFGTAQIRLPMNWHMDPFENRSWVWLLHQFDFFNHLLAFERVNKGRQGYDLALRIAFSWWAKFSNAKNSPDFAWHDHGSANRAMSMLRLRQALIDAKIRTSEKTDKFFNVFFTAHANFLADEKEYSKGTNHGLDQSLALFTLAAENKSLPWSKKYLSLALSRLDFELHRSFKDDGGHTENSVHYQEFGMRQIIKALRLFRKYKPTQIDKTTPLQDQLEKASLAMAYMIAPNGMCPAVGDTEYSGFPDILSKVTDLPTYTHYLYANSAGKQGTPPTAPDLILPQSGWAALRSGWTGENDLHLLTKCAFNSRYHRHDDDTSFVLHALGEEWITDGGLYKYEEKDPMRMHLRSHYAHSLSAPDGVLPVRNIKTHGGRNRIEDHHSGDDSAWVQMVSHLFPGYVAQRRIGLERPARKLVISDRLVPEDGADPVASCTTRFLVPLDKAVTVEGPNVRVAGAKASLVIRPDRKPARIAVITGQSEPELRGWRSGSFNTVDKAHCIEFGYDGGTLDVRYKLSFE